MKSRSSKQGSTVPRARRTFGIAEKAHSYRGGRGTAALCRLILVPWAAMGQRRTGPLGSLLPPRGLCRPRRRGCVSLRPGGLLHHGDRPGQRWRKSASDMPRPVQAGAAVHDGLSLMSARSATGKADTPSRGNSPTALAVARGSVWATGKRSRGTASNNLQAPLADLKHFSLQAGCRATAALAFRGFFCCCPSTANC